MGGRFKFVIIGNGNASKSALEALARMRVSGDILVVSREGRRAYSPTILPYYILGSITDERLFLDPRLPGGFRSVNFVGEKEVTRVDPGRNRIMLDGKDEIFYERLLICSGASPALPSVKGLEIGRVFTLRSLDDARAIKEGLRHSKEVAIVGAGLIGMHLAEVSTRLGVKTIVIEKEDRVLPRSFDKRAGLLIRRVFEAHGVEFLLSDRIEAIEGRPGGRSRIILDEAGPVDCDMVVFAAGVEPNVKFLEGTDVEVDRGILVDHFMRTSVPNVFAAGDVAQGPDFFSGRNVLNPILPEAVLQGKVAAWNMGGRSVRFRGNISRNVFHFFGHCAFSLGLADEQAEGDMEIHVDEDPKTGRYRKLVFRGNRMVGAVGIDDILDSGALLSLIAEDQGREAIKEELLAPRTDHNVWLRWIVCKHIHRSAHSGEIR